MQGDGLLNLDTRTAARPEASPYLPGKIAASSGEIFHRVTAAATVKWLSRRIDDRPDRDANGRANRLGEPRA